MKTTLENLRDYADIVAEYPELKEMAKSMRKDALRVEEMYRGIWLVFGTLICLLFFACVLLYNLYQVNTQLYNQLL